MARRKVTGVLAVGAASLLLGGCEMLTEEEAWAPREADAISVSEEGQITEYISETLEQPYYSSEELEGMVNAETAKYNSRNGADRVLLQSFEAEGRTVKLVLEYTSAADYAAFNHVECFSGSMIDAQLAGYLFDTSYKKVEDGVVQGDPVSGRSVLKDMAAEVLVVEAPLEVNVPGKVLYTSTNAEVLSADTVSASGEAEEAENSGLELPSGASYQEEAPEKSLEERAAAKRVYIIYEME